MNTLSKSVKQALFYFEGRGIKRYNIFERKMMVCTKKLRIYFDSAIQYL